MDGEEFQMRCWEVMESNLSTNEKLMLIGMMLYQGNPTRERLSTGTSLSYEQIDELTIDLVDKGWIKVRD